MDAFDSFGQGRNSRGGVQRGDTQDPYAGFAGMPAGSPTAPAGHAADPSVPTSSLSRSIAMLPPSAQANAIIGSADTSSTAAYRQMAAQMEASRRLESDLAASMAAMRSRMEGMRAAQAQSSMFADQRSIAPAGFVAGASSAMGGSSVSMRSNAARRPVVPAGQVSSMMTAAAPQAPGRAGMAPEDAWLAHMGLNADGWLDMHENVRAAALHKSGCAPADVAAVVMAVDSHSLRRTGRRPMVNIAGGGKNSGAYPNPYSMVPVSPAGQVAFGSNGLDVTFPWWFLILGGAGLMWWYAGRRK